MPSGRRQRWIDMEDKILKWSKVKVGELGLLSKDYEIEIDGDKKTVKVMARRSP